ncbi:unnamed protein product [Onchocerca ochengi]|uniref:TLE_N domain-containing protein n=1 Tax=Onchocerca ochengi TaxID=42157 RepID=A0A182ETJ0_ONCOC|nr:unnamed protein product [Onchocerca ochengi]
MPHRRLLIRPINSLYPLEVGAVSNSRSQSPVLDKSTHESKQEEPITRRTRSATRNRVPGPTPEQNFTATTVAVCTRTHVRIPAIRCYNITRTVCTKAFLRLSLSVISDKMTTSATSTHFCKTLDDQKKHNGKASSNLTPEGQIIMMKTSLQEVTHPENTRFQSIVYSLQQEFNQRLSLMYLAKLPKSEQPTVVDGMDVSQ